MNSLLPVCICAKRTVLSGGDCWTSARFRLDSAALQPRPIRTDPLYFTSLLAQLILPVFKTEFPLRGLIASHFLLPLNSQLILFHLLQQRKWKQAEKHIYTLVPLLLRIYFPLTHKGLSFSEKVTISLFEVLFIFCCNYLSFFLYCQLHSSLLNNLRWACYCIKNEHKENSHCLAGCHTFLCSFRHHLKLKSVALCFLLFSLSLLQRSLISPSPRALLPLRPKVTSTRWNSLVTP